MSEANEGFQTVEPPESVQSGFELLKNWWENYFNSTELSQTEFDRQSRRAIKAIDELTQHRHKEVVFWGRAFQAELSGEDGMIYCTPRFFDNKYWGRSDGALILNIPVEEGGSGLWEVVHQINFQQKVGNHFSVGSYLFSYDRANYEFISPLVPEVESSIIQDQAHSPTELLQQRRRILDGVAENVRMSLNDGYFEAMDIPKREAFLQKRAETAKACSGILHRDIFIRSAAGYVLNYDTEGIPGFMPAILPESAMPARCLDITSFEALDLGWHAEGTRLPLHEGLCLALDVSYPIDDIEPTQIVYVPLSENELEYDLQVNERARQNAQQGGQS